MKMIHLIDFIKLLPQTDNQLPISRTSFQMIMCVENLCDFKKLARVHSVLFSSILLTFSPSTLEDSVFKKHRFQIAPLWRAFSNGFVFGDRFPRCSVDDRPVVSILMTSPNKN